MPIGFVVFVLLHIPLCYWFVGMLKKRRAKKMKVSSPLSPLLVLIPPMLGNSVAIIWMGSHTAWVQHKCFPEIMKLQRVECHRSTCRV